ncbi:VOC family protein [Halomonas organivorans]|uniref:Catechol 2,3-dioxygenase-like lactoylglutathione lyase family enzyme n=1 Tax=Halomonas organivorans TaxID=257772 RepID=A0A7W5BVA5_9GAMM|nr:VOC family protein [Halomonas organivorans]MBB3139797.1 catechol 2,3-dioxygenase-like lactoylglutathione lyase family enzyme [Halomonas organivorans]
MHVHPLIAVENIERSLAWYGRLLGCESHHGDSACAQLRLPGTKTTLLQLQLWNGLDHPGLEASFAGPGHGVLLWFEVEDFDDALDRAREMDAWIVREPAISAHTRRRECWLRDPDGYHVVLADSAGERD